VKDNTDKPLDVHLMIVDPDRYIDRCKDFGADIVTVHYEACRHLHRTVAAIKAAGMKAGVSINPHVPVSVLEEILPYVDLILIMSVNPGYGGQAFIETSVEKVRKLKKMITDGGYNVTIEIDGGVNERTGRLLVDAGADALVAGNYVVSAADRTAAIRSLQELR
ncbi:MAG: ribulose-phosphate 3-epimerase, partial [Bacteroidaceae bacterium]|nr:ribulose-phosphate 3-epimerase [Bacteroidaceae bacterium]